MDIEDRNILAIRAREKVTSTLSTQEIFGLPKYFGWVECVISDKCKFYMFQGGCDDMVAAKFFYNKQYEALSLRIWCELAAQTACIIDIGAHTGAFSLAASAANSKASIIAIEPVAQNYSRMLLNFSANEMNNITSIQAAVSSQNGAKNLHVPDTPGYMTQGASFSGFAEGYKKTTVPAISIDQALKFEKHLPQLVKIDTEGHEYETLTGMQMLIKKAQPVIFLECNNTDATNKLNTLKPLLKDYGIFVIDDEQMKLEKTDNFSVLVNETGELARSKMNRLLIPRKHKSLSALKRRFQ